MRSSKESRVPEPEKKITNSKPLPHIPLPFEEVMKDVLRVKPPEKTAQAKPKKEKDEHA